ncbi:hypothetical protein KsCSTR_45630 [Candidatus Kuenenia stuttgartiensis]|uniref:Uncharacterized protein n=1 Tax=Kuenenia stuttgartiensis TaxID=174633 RepID=Q1PWG4_KUEST|nr:hypothetical protein KsCSTR_45630 [Candidatus Kuenenia stuttgartiensis]CAJ71574.1 unknown protein [Candidatus Kuenenia stuttgartiensis]
MPIKWAAIPGCYSNRLIGNTPWRIQVCDLNQWVYMLTTLCANDDGINNIKLKKLWAKNGLRGGQKS